VLSSVVDCLSLAAAFAEATGTYLVFGDSTPMAGQISEAGGGTGGSATGAVVVFMVVVAAAVDGAAACSASEGGAVVLDAAVVAVAAAADGALFLFIGGFTAFLRGAILL
jgi:hypothetical protein